MKRRIKTDLLDDLEARPPSWLQGVYVGQVAHLRGRTALLRLNPDTAGGYLAQFDERSLKESHQWNRFACFEFSLFEMPASPRLCLREDYRTAIVDGLRIHIWAFTYSDGTVEVLNRRESLERNENHAT